MQSPARFPQSRDDTADRLFRVLDRLDQWLSVIAEPQVDYRFLDNDDLQAISLTGTIPAGSGSAVNPGGPVNLCNFTGRPGGAMALTFHVDVVVPNALTLLNPAGQFVDVRLNLQWATSRGGPKSAQISARRGLSFSLAGQTIIIDAVNFGTQPVVVALGIGAGTLATPTLPTLLLPADISAQVAGVFNIPTIPKYARSLFIFRLPQANPITLSQGLETNSPKTFLAQDNALAGAISPQFRLHENAQSLQIASGGVAWTRVDLSYEIDL